MFKVKIWCYTGGCANSAVWDGPRIAACYLLDECIIINLPTTCSLTFFFWMTEVHTCSSFTLFLFYFAQSFVCLNRSSNFFYHSFRCLIKRRTQKMWVTFINLLLLLLVFSWFYAVYAVLVLVRICTKWQWTSLNVYLSDSSQQRMFYCLLYYTEKRHRSFHFNKFV